METDNNFFVTDKNMVTLGKNIHIDPTAIVGCRAQRNIKDRGIIIGDGAIIRSGSVIYEGVTIGPGFETGHGVVIREENIIGSNVQVWSHSVVDYGCRIGSGVKIHNLVYVAQFTELEDEVFLAPGVMIGNDKHPICTKCMKGPVIKRKARIGINATIGPRIVIGEGAVIAAGSVVVSDIPAFMLAAGIPARPVKSVHDIQCSQGLEPPYPLDER